LIDQANLSTYLSLLTPPIELRILNTTKGTIAGYYDDVQKLKQDIEFISDNEPFGRIQTVYTTLNEVRPDLLARSHNRFQPYAKHTTADADIIHRLWLPIDADAGQPAGTSSTDDEQARAFELAESVRRYLHESGFPSPIYGDSGNGAHLLYKFNAGNTPEVTNMLKTFYDALKAKHSIGQARIDATVFNAARVWKCYGTMVRKGDEVAGRKHRMARIIDRPAELVPVDLQLIENVTAKLTAKPIPPKQLAGSLDWNSMLADLNHAEAGQTDIGKSVSFVESFLQKHDIERRGESKEYNGGRKWNLVTCPLCGESDKSAVVMVMANGAKAYHCAHNRCSGKGWQEFRQHFEPDYKSKTIKPVIVTGGQVAGTVADALAAIHAANDPPQWFTRAGFFTRLRVRPANNMPYFEAVKEGGILDILSTVANWKKYGKEKALVDNPNIPADVRKIILDKADTGLPVVRSIVETPAFTSTGRLLTTPGYDPESQTWFWPANGQQIPDIVSSPTEADLTRAKSLILDDVLVDFPFVDQASRAHAVAMLLLPFIRQMIDGPTPLHLIDAPTEGTGKGLLARCFAIIATGRDERATPECREEAEFAKTLTSALLEGPAYVLLDNITKPIHSATFAAILTTRHHESRLLGGNKMATLPVDCVWIATGNNVHASKEINRRMVRIRLDAMEENPQFRAGFKHDDLEGWVKANRVDLVWAMLTLCRAWIAKGKPAGKKTLGSFSKWAIVLGGILDVVGIGGFLENLKEQYAEVNTTDGKWRAFVLAWWERFKDQAIPASELVPIAMLCDVLEAEKNPSQVLGHALGNRLHKIFVGYRIERASEDRHGTARYCLNLVPLKLLANRTMYPETSDSRNNGKPVETSQVGRTADLAVDPLRIDRENHAPVWATATPELIARNGRQVGKGWIIEQQYGTNRKPLEVYKVGSFNSRFGTWPPENTIDWHSTVNSKQAARALIPKPPLTSKPIPVDVVEPKPGRQSELVPDFLERLERLPV